MDDNDLKKALSLVGDKWSPQILYFLHKNGPSRFGECQHLAMVNTKTLTQRLVSLEKGGLISKEEYSEYPPRTVYSLTSKGLALVPVFESMAVWAEQNLKV